MNTSKRPGHSAMRRPQVVLGVAVSFLCLAIIGVALLASRSDSGPAPGTLPSANPSAELPTGALPAGDQYEFGVSINALLDTPAKPDAPVVAVWEDFQCPACAAFEKLVGSKLVDLARAGDIQLIARPTTFLDRNLDTDASARATAAWAAAIEANRGVEFRDLLFANQPTIEGQGWTNEELLELARQSGMSEADVASMGQSLASGRFLEWVANATKAFYDAAVTGTPAVTVDGIVITDLSPLVQSEDNLLTSLRKAAENASPSR